MVSFLVRCPGLLGSLSGLVFLLGSITPAPGVGASSQMDITKTSKILWAFMR